MSINRKRDRAIRAIQAEHGVKYSVARAMWEQGNPEYAARYREARVRVSENARRPPTVNLDRFLVDLEGRTLAQLQLEPAPGVPGGRVLSVRALGGVRVDRARSTSDGVLKWALHVDAELTCGGTWTGSIADAHLAPHVVAVDPDRGEVTLTPAVARVTFHISAKGNPPVLRDAHATLSWVQDEAST